MKLFIASVLLALAASAQAALRDGSPNPFDGNIEFKGCLTKFGWTQNGTMLHTDTPHNDRDEAMKKIGCFVQCKMEESGLWKNGGLDTAAAENKLMDMFPNFKEGVQECAGEKGAGDCEKASKIFVCLRKKIFPQISSLPEDLQDGSPNPFNSGVEFKVCLQKFGWKQNGAILRVPKSDADTFKQKLGCFKKCKMEESGLWRNGGLDTTVAEEKLIDMLPNSKADIQECAAEKGADDCETASKIFECLKKKVVSSFLKSTN